MIAEEPGSDKWSKPYSHIPAPEGTVVIRRYIELGKQRKTDEFPDSTEGRRAALTREAELNKQVDNSNTIVYFTIDSSGNLVLPPQTRSS